MTSFAPHWNDQLDSSLLHVSHGLSRSSGKRGGFAHTIKLQFLRERREIPLLDVGGIASSVLAWGDRSLGRKLPKLPRAK
jgi:hypothetical protein